MIFGNHRIAIDKQEISNTTLLTRDQGLQWFDLQGRLLGSEGLVVDASVPPVPGARQLTDGGHTFDTFAMPILDPKSGASVGIVRASEWNEQLRKQMLGLDTGLAIGTLLAVIGSGLGGLALARRAVRPVAQTFRTLRDFTADASHELRGPLTAIAGNADAGLRDERDPGRDRSRFEAIADGARQMSRLTSDLLLLASADRTLESELFVVDVAALLPKLAQRYEAQFAEAAVTLTVASGHSAIAYGNPDQIERIVANLIENALRYTPRGGSVRVEILRDRTHLRVVVRDTGIGIAPDNHDRIFDRFWRADPSRANEGSGLGLAIARALARRHGGDVAVASSLGAGSAFTASFPTRPPRVE
jgi:signal transduction histidine kinase